MEYCSLPPLKRDTVQAYWGGGGGELDRKDWIEKQGSAQLPWPFALAPTPYVLRNQNGGKHLV